MLRFLLVLTVVCSCGSGAEDMSCEFAGSCEPLQHGSGSTLLQARQWMHETEGVREDTEGTAHDDLEAEVAAENEEYVDEEDTEVMARDDMAAEKDEEENEKYVDEEGIEVMAHDDLDADFAAEKGDEENDEYSDGDVDGGGLAEHNPDIQLVAAAETTLGGGSFAAARPGSCCPGSPTTYLSWSKFVDTAAYREAKSPGGPVVVPCGLEITMDTSVAGLHGLRVMGSLKFQEGVDIVLETDHILVCGRFTIGSNMSAHTSKVEIVLTGQTAVEWRGKGFGIAPFATYGGELYIRGAACGERSSWTRLSAPVAKNLQVSTENLALRKPTASSSRGHHRARPEKLVDGGYHWRHNSFFTAKEVNAWWYVRNDALANRGVAKVVLTRRAWGTDLSKVHVGVATVACQKGQLCAGSLCKYKSTHRGRRIIQDNFDCHGAKGSFVYVQWPGEGMLSLAEAAVYSPTVLVERDLFFQGGVPFAWKAGDRVLITSTSYSAKESEEATIVSTRQDGIKVSGAFNADHAGCDASTDCVIAAEVALLSRNVVVRGRTGCAPKCGHFMHAHTNHGFICGAEFTNLGQTAVEGRYPMHIHLPGDAPNLIVADNALHDNHNRGVVMHGVHGMLVKDNTCYRTKGHCFMTEDGVEQHNRIIGNLGVLVFPQHFGCKHSHDMTFKCSHRSDNSPNAFWLSNPNNILDGNVGVVTGGAYFIETRHVMGVTRREFKSEAMKVGRRGKLKGSTPLQQFTNNMAHSSNTGIGNYPRVGFTKGGRNAYESFTAWKCSGVGIAVHAGGSAIQVRKAHLVQNTIGIAVFGGKVQVTESRISVRPGFHFWNKGTKYVSAPLTFHARMGKSRGSLISAKFILDPFTVNWVRCHGGYDAKALSFKGWRGDWFALFKDKAKLRTCPPK